MRESRRKFLGRLAALAGGGVAAGLAAAGCAGAGPTVYRYAPSGDIIDLFLSWYPELNRTGGVVELLLTGTGRSVVVARTAIDRFTAVSPLCPEDACRADLRENSFRCSCHGGRWEIDGSPARGAGGKPLVSYRTEFRETSLRIFLR